MAGTVGIKYDTSSTIRTLREILGHYKPGFPLVRELLQNADDAGATTLELGWLPSLPGARNPLLGGPALFVLNDGPFTDSNAEAITGISGSDKGNQDGAIGKFGRGLKSVFHLCEGFVFAASVQAGGGEGRWPLERATLFTPWNDSPYHEDWQDFDDVDEEALAKAIVPYLPTGRHWFCLWIPLRRGPAGLPPPIQEDAFPGDSALAPDFLREEVAGGCVETMQALPLLRWLRSVRYHLPGATPCAVEFEEGSTRRRFDATRPEPGRWPLKGMLVAGNARAVYAGHEVLLRDGRFETLKAREGWPARDPLAGGREKGEPHAAVVFSAVPARGGGSLRAADAVFLPVGRRPEPVACRSRWDIDVLLHGYYFVNSNRTAIEFEASGTDARSQLTAEWNRELRSRGVMSALVPALEEFVAATSMSLRDVEVLTGSLADWLKRRPRDLDDARLAHQWLACLGPTGETGYGRLAGDSAYFELPRPAGDELPLRVFPAMVELASRVPVTFKGMARLADSPSPWDADDLNTLLQSVPSSEVFASEIALDYLAAVLDATSSAKGNLQQTLISKLQEALVSPGLARMRDSSAFRRVLRHVDRGLLLTFDDRQLAAAARVVNEATAYLASAAVSVLVVPASAVGERQQGEPELFELGDHDATGLLQALIEVPVSLQSEDAFRQIRARLADTVFRLDGRAGEVARAEFGDSRLFRGWVAGSGDANISFKDIQRAVETRRLLRRNVSGGVDPAPALAEAAALVGDLTVVPD